jgi:hypothetical protein
MLISFYRGILATINQWFESTCTIIDPTSIHVRVRINESERLQMFSERQRRMRNLKYKR